MARFFHQPAKAPSNSPTADERDGEETIIEFLIGLVSRHWNVWFISAEDPGVEGIAFFFLRRLWLP